MEQRSDVAFRAEKLYKNSREKFWFLIREVVSNAIHAVIIKQKRENEGKNIPRVEFTAATQESGVEILVKDYGDGFNEKNRHYFTHLDSKNPDKEGLKLRPMGQGRLAIVYFSDKATYTSTHVNSSGIFQKMSFEYPERSLDLFDFDDSAISLSKEKFTETILRISINKHQTLGRAKTFFNKYDNIEKLKGWFVETFFPFFMEYEDLNLAVNLNGQGATINRKYIEKNVRSVPFTVDFGEEQSGKREFKIWLIEVPATPKSRNHITCFARHLSAELEGSKIEYEIDLPQAYDWFLTSDYFDDNVDQKGDKIEISEWAACEIQASMERALNEEFQRHIESNRVQTKGNIHNVKEKYHSLGVFVDEQKNCESKTILSETEIVNHAIEEKGRAEKAYWTDQGADEDKTERLLNSSLQIYIDHRGRVLEKLKTLIRRFDEDGIQKSELEDDVHDLFFKRGNTLNDSVNKNHLHNLWILDDKYTIFSNAHQARSSKRGQRASDIYIWADDPETTRELLILELKSTSNAHNAGDKYESMVAQVKRYAAQFYREPQKVLSWDVDPSKVLYSGFILARKSDIHRELNSNNSEGSPEKIPFLDSSYYFNTKFSVGDNNAAPIFKEIRIEMYSYEDIYQLAMARNGVFFKLLKDEFNVNRD